MGHESSRWHALWAEPAVVEARRLQLTRDLRALGLPAALRPGPTLDVACGLGEALDLLAAAGAPEPLLGLDLRPAPLAGAAMLIGRAEALPLADDSVANLLCLHSLHHLDDTHRFLREARRVLRPGGVLALCDHHDSPWWRVMMAIARTGLLDRAGLPHGGELLREEAAHLARVGPTRWSQLRSRLRELGFVTSALAHGALSWSWLGTRR